MQIPVFLEPVKGNGYRARGTEPPGTQIEKMLLNRLSQNTSDNPKKFRQPAS